MLVARDQAEAEDNAADEAFGRASKMYYAFNMCIRPALKGRLVVIKLSFVGDNLA